MRIFPLLAFVAFGLPMVSCAPKDPDLDPQPTTPESSSSQVPWNKPVTGQGGGAFGALPNQQLRR